MKKIILLLLAITSTVVFANTKADSVDDVAKAFF